ncbi:MAG: histidine kinase [Bacteroidota bacterium]
MEELDYTSTLNAVLYSLSILSCIITSTYFHYFKLLPILNSGRRVLYFSLTTVLIICVSTLIYVVFLLLPYAYDYEEGWDFISNFIYYCVLITIIFAGSSLYYFVEAWYRNIQTENLLRNEKLQAELNFLKSQINPHFLFNTLNNIYSYAQTNNPKTAPMLERLSSILRFMVYDCGEDIVELPKEIRAVENLLEIQKMKNSEQRNIQLVVEGVKSYHLIAPLIIVNFVENACKHSDVVSNPNGFIKVTISIDSNNQCLLNIANSTKRKTILPTKYQGVGLENSRKRLELQYPGTHSLEEQKMENEYQLKLSIPLKRK